MTHQECQDRLLELSYGELDPGRAREVQAHLAGCPACAGVYRRIAGVREVMGRLEPEPPPAGGDRVLLAAAREAADRRREERPSLGLPLWVWKASVATVLVAAVAGVSVRIASMRQRSQVEEVAEAPAGPAAGPAPEASPRPTPPSAMAEAPGGPAPAERPAVAARAARERAPSPAAAPAPSRIGFAERGAADVEVLAEPEPRRGAVARVPTAPRATRQLAAAEPPVAAGRAAAAKGEAEAKAAAPPAATAGAPAALQRAAPSAPAPQAAPEESPPPEEAPAEAPPSEAAPIESAPPQAAPAETPQPVAPPPAPASASRKSPAVKAAQAVVQGVESQLRKGALTEAARPFQACGPGEDAERRTYADAAGRVVKYVRQVGSAEAALTYEQYYDAEGRLRHVYIHGGAVSGAVVEHRIWLDGAGRRLREEQRFRRGRYPFPEIWPESELRQEAPDASALRCGAP